MHSRNSTARVAGIRAGFFIVVLLCANASFSQEKGDAFVAQSNATVDIVQAITDSELGAVQGIVVRAEKVYAYGDLVKASPRVGVIREYDLGLHATGRSIRLTRQGTPVIVHPTGLTWNERWGTFLGDTLKKKAIIYRLDWEQAWEDGNLDRAVLATLDDDAAINGCRPLFVQVRERTFLATADYGEVHPEIRLYDPDLLLAQGRSSAPGVVVHRVLCGPFNQNLYWDEGTGTLTCVQNVVEGKGWRLDKLDLMKALVDGRAHGTDVRLQLLTFPFADELEGYWPLEGNRVFLAVARRRDNVILGTIRIAGSQTPD